VHEWDNFAVVVGGSAGALVGLLFVAISIHAGRIAESAELRGRAAQTLVIFAALLLIAVLLTIPAQPERHRTHLATGTGIRPSPRRAV
jgi:hypothetical protein